MSFSEEIRQRFGRYIFSRLCPLLFALIATGAMPGEAAAQGAMTSEQVQRFKLRVSDGKRLFEMGKYRASVEQFQAARKIYDHPRLTFNIAQAYKALGACTESRGAFERYLDTPKISEKMRARATKLLSELDTSCIETGSIRISCAPEDAAVTITRLNPDGARGTPRRATCPITSKIRTGRYEISARAEGFEPVVQQVVVARNATQILRLALRPQPGIFDMETRSILSYSVIGLGAATLVGGLISDYTAVSRLDELRQAQSQGDSARIDALRDEADSASTRSAILYGVGAAVLAGGIAWKVIQITSEAEPAADQRASVQGAESQFSVQFGLTGLSTRFDW
jgi:hypothetical protein